MDLRKTLILQLFLSILTFSANNYGCCIEGQRPPSPDKIQLQAFNTNQTLVVRWLTNQSHLQEQQEHYEVQIARPGYVYNESVHRYGGDGVHTLAWPSPLPLECADHSVRIRRFYDDSISSPWSQWTTNFGLLREKAKTTRMYPFDQVMLAGTRPWLCCIPRDGADITKMSFNKTPYKDRLISIGDRVKAIQAGVLTIPNGTFKRLRFSCTDSATSEPHISVIFPSIPPEKPRNLTCETSDLKNVICTWEPGKKDHLLGRNKRTQTIYINLPNSGNSGGQYTCEESSCKFPLVPGLEEYHLSLLVSNPLGKQSARYSFNISERVFPVAKWYQVRHGVTEANVSWSVDGFLSPLELLCQVTLNNVSLEGCGGREDGFFQANVRDLLPSTLYFPRVRCGMKGKTPGKWSQSMNFTTYPLVTLDLWKKINLFSNNSQSVTLIWYLHVLGSEEEAVVERYKIQEGEFHTTWADPGQRQADISVGPGQCEITVQAVLQNGYYIPAKITIPPVEAGERTVVEQRVNFSTQLSWKGEDWSTCGYTVEWCIPGKVPCDLQWRKLPRGKSLLVLNPRDYEDGVRYTFNIYGCTENGHKLLEIRTGYFLELKPVEIPRLMVPVTRTYSSVRLEWNYNEEDPTHPGWIIGYLVTVQEVDHEGSPDQTSKLFNVSEMDPRRKSVTIKGLQEDTMYQFRLSALTKAGPGPVLTTTIKTSSNLLVYWLKILTPLAFLLSCSILLCHQRKILKSWRNRTFDFPDVMKYKAFELESFLQETSRKLDTKQLEECVCCDVEIIYTKQLPQ